MSRRISVSLFFNNDGEKVIDAPDSQLLSQLLPMLLNTLEGDNAGNPDDYIVYAARPINRSSQEPTLGDLLQNGEALCIVRVGRGAVVARLELLIVQPDGRRERWRTITQPSAILGRDPTDKEYEHIPLDLDLTALLKADKQRKVSRRQAVISSRDGQWWIRLHEKAGAPFVVDGQTLHPNERPDPVLLRSGTVLTFGSLNDPALQLEVKLGEG